MNCESWLRPKKSRMTALRAFGLISFCGVMISILASNKVMRSLTRRSVRARPSRHWLASNSPTVRTRRLPRWSMSSKYLLRLKKGEGSLDDIDHLGSRRVRTVGELRANQCRLGPDRTERPFHERTT